MSHHLVTQGTLPSHMHSATCKALATPSWAATDRHRKERRVHAGLLVTPCVMEWNMCACVCVPSARRACGLPETDTDVRTSWSKGRKKTKTKAFSRPPPCNLPRPPRPSPSSSEERGFEHQAGLDTSRQDVQSTAADYSVGEVGGSADRARQYEALPGRDCATRRSGVAIEYGTL